jgi:hypothetical protein
MAGLYKLSETAIEQDGVSIKLEDLLSKNLTRTDEKSFLIPSQRVLSLKDGLTRTFTDFRSGDPYSIREFSEILHFLVQSEFGKNEALFPVANRLRNEERALLAEHIFGKFGLKSDQEKFQRRLVLSAGEGSALPYLVWSAGQREFVPLLLGLYWLMPPSKISKRNHIEWVFIEELEMGLHPNAISVVLLLVMDLLKRGYKVCLSTHSPHVLDVVWALRILRENGGKWEDVRDIFSSKSMKDVAESALKNDARVYYFQKDGIVKDISTLDPGSDQTGESGWGGLTEFSGRVGDIVARVINRSSMKPSKRSARKEK